MYRGEYHVAPRVTSRLLIVILSQGYTPSYDHLGNLLECLCPEFSLPPNNYCEPDDDNNHSGEGKCNSCKSGWCSNWGESQIISLRGKSDPDAEVSFLACTPGGSQACYGDDCKSGGHYCGDGDKDGQWWDDLTHSWQFSISFNKRDYQRQLQLASRCPANTQACPLFGGRGFECLDTKNDIESCGGCRYSRKNPGADCTAIENSEGVSCINSQCVVETCSPGFAPSEDGKGCIIDPLRKRNKNVYEMDLLLE